jgi:1,4-dihydroxy-2-naphthoate octaprenyltransferase
MKSMSPSVSAEATALSERPTSTWRLALAAIRPATLTAALCPVAVGTALAAADDAVMWLPALFALVGALLIQIGTNLFNDYADFKKGADTSERLGPSRVTQKGWMTPRQVALSAAAAFGAAMAVGVYLVVVGGWPIVAIGLLSVLCGVAYTGGPYPLAYVGLGDVFVLVFFGLVAVGGTYYVQALTLTSTVVLASIGVGTLATAILVVNNLRDRWTDEKVGKRTLAVRYGAGFARAEYVALIGVAYAIPIFVWIAGTPGWMLCWLSVPMALREIRAVLQRDGADLNPHLGRTAKLGLLYSALLSVGVLL